MRILRTIIFILVCIGLIWLFIALMVRAFNGGNNTDVVEPAALTTYADTNTESQMYIDGPIIQNEEHEAIRITVGRTQTKIEIIRGYNNRVINQQAYINTENSYEQFLAALDQLGFSQGLVDDPTPTEQGRCPGGNRIIYTLEDGSDLIGRGWSTTCGPGSFGTNRIPIKNLFTNQIPHDDYIEITKGLTVV